MDIKITDYLDEQEIKDIVSSELRNQIRIHFKDEENAKRLLSNLAYNIVSEEVNKIVPDYEQEIIRKVAELINKKDLSYHIFDFDTYGNGKARSLGAKILEQTVRENTELIKSKVVEGIQNKNYSEEALLRMENLSDSFAGNIYEFVELMRSK